MQVALDLVKARGQRGEVGLLASAIYLFLPWQFLNFLPLPHGQGSLRPTPT